MTPRLQATIFFTFKLYTYKWCSFLLRIISPSEIWSRITSWVDCASLLFRVITSIYRWVSSPFHQVTIPQHIILIFRNSYNVLQKSLHADRKDSVISVWDHVRWQLILGRPLLADIFEIRVNTPVSSPSALTKAHKHPRNTGSPASWISDTRIQLENNLAFSELFGEFFTTA